MKQWTIVLWLLVGFAFGHFSTTNADELADLKATIEQLKTENAALKAEIARLQSKEESRQTQPADRSESAGSSSEPVNKNAANSQTRPVSLKEILAYIDAGMKQVKEQKTSVLKNELFAKLIAAIQKRIEDIELMTVTSSVEDVSPVEDGVVTLRLNGIAELNYGDPKAKRNIFCNVPPSIRVKMSSDLARQLKPGTPIAILGKPAFATSGKGPGQHIVWVMNVCYISMTNHKVMVGNLTFDPA